MFVIISKHKDDTERTKHFKLVPKKYDKCKRFLKLD